MQNYLLSILIGGLQGITEFFPISSSAHTLLVYHFIEIKNIDIIFLQIVVHFGTLLAILIYYRKRLVIYVQAIYKRYIKKDTSESTQKEIQIIYYLILGTIPLAIFGYFFESYIENVVHVYIIVPYTLLIGGILFILIEKYSKNNYNQITDIKQKHAILIGISQVLALVPGVSRSGITILTGMTLGFKRNIAAEFTFLLAIPTLLGVSIKKFIDLQSHTFQSGEIQFYIIAFFASFIIGFFAIKYLLQYLQSHSLRLFGWYRIILALLLLLIF